MEYTYCEGSHFCPLCQQTFNCEGEDPSHTGKAGSGRCMGEQEQFCSNHDIQEYIDYHKEHGEI